VDEAATRAAWTTTLRGGALPMLLGVGAWTVKPGASTLGDERTAKARCAHKGCGKALLVKPGSAGHPCCDNCFEKHHRAKFEAEGAALQAAIDEDRA
jgi:hypothetical protein